MDPIPAPIQRTIVRALVCTASVTLFGVIWGIAAHDGTLPALSALIAVFGSQKAVSMIRDARKGRFQTVECTVLSDRRSPLPGRHQLRIVTAGHKEALIPLSGRRTLKPGCSYRLYLSGGEDDAFSAFPELLRPARTLLGCETIGVFSADTPDSGIMEHPDGGVYTDTVSK